MTCFPFWRVVRERKGKVRGVIMKRVREREGEEAGGAEIKSLQLVLREKKETKSKVCG
jgi:hypothetical protein